MIKTTNLFYNYDSKFSALYNINIKFENNTIILSDELSSKTLFRVLSKQDTDYIGEVFINNKNLKEIKLKDLSLSYITNPPYLLKNKTISYNIAYPLIIRKENKKQALQKSIEIMQQFELSDKKIKGCTYFEKLLTALLRTFIRHPKIILIDDIFTNLKEEEQCVILNVISNLSKNSLIIIALNNKKMLNKFKDYKIIKLLNGSIEK